MFVLYILSGLFQNYSMFIYTLYTVYLLITKNKNKNQKTKNRNTKVPILEHKNKNNKKPSKSTFC